MKGRSNSLDSLRGMDILLIISFLGITHTAIYLNALEASAWGGSLRGILFTSVVAWITVQATKRKIFWKT